MQGRCREGAGKVQGRCREGAGKVHRLEEQHPQHKGRHCEVCLAGRGRFREGSGKVQGRFREGSGRHCEVCLKHRRVREVRDGLEAAPGPGDQSIHRPRSWLPQHGARTGCQQTCYSGSNLGACQVSMGQGVPRGARCQWGGRSNTRARTRQQTCLHAPRDGMVRRALRCGSVRPSTSCQPTASWVGGSTESRASCGSLPSRHCRMERMRGGRSQQKRQANDLRHLAVFACLSARVLRLLICDVLC